MDDIPPLANMTIDELLRRWPSTMIIIQQLKLACLGCAVATFCTVNEAADLHGLDRGYLIDRLLQAIQENLHDD